MISNYITTQDKKICILTKEGIIYIHQLLSTNYHLLKDMDPVSPPGVKNLPLLESAVDRQHVGSGNWYKYPNFFNNCATLTYGVIKNHKGGITKCILYTSTPKMPQPQCIS